MPPNKVNLSWCSILHCSRLFRAQLLLGALFFYCGYHAEKWRAHERRWVLSAAVPLWPRVRDTEQSPRRSHDFPLLHLEKQLVDEVYHVQPWRELNSFQLNSPCRGTPTFYSWLHPKSTSMAGWCRWTSRQLKSDYRHRSPEKKWTEKGSGNATGQTGYDMIWQLLAGLRINDC